jgi:hypothetical protein
MNSLIRSFEPLQDCCCMGAPRILLRSATGMAFNFSAAPEKAPPSGLHIAAAQPQSHSNVPRSARQIFSSLDFFPAY